MRDLTNTPFSIERLFVWSVGIGFITGLLAMILQNPVKAQVQSVTMFCLGAIVNEMKGILRRK